MALLESRFSVRAAVQRLSIVFIGVISAQSAFALEETPTGTLVADSNDSAISYRIFDSDSNSVPDVEVTGATIGNGIYLNITSINSTAASNPGSITLNVSGGSTTTVSALNSGTVSVPGFAAVNFSAIENLAGGAGNETFFMDAVITGTVNGGAGVDMIVGVDTGNSFQVNAADSGTVNGSAFVNVENLTGGPGVDVFAFSASLSGAAAGGAGDDTFSFADGGAVAQADGGAGVDMIVGVDTGNSFQVNAADSGTVNGSAFVNVENLTGGPGVDVFTFSASLAGAAAGGTGDDIFDVVDGGAFAQIDGGAGADALSYASLTSGVSLQLDLVAAIETVTGSSSGDTISLNGDLGNGIVIDGGGGGSDLFEVAGNSQILGNLVVINVDQAAIDATVIADNITLNVDGPIAGAGVLTAEGDITITGAAGGDVDVQFGAGGAGGVLNMSWTSLSPLSVSATGGAGSDTLVIITVAESLVWDVNATNAGTMTSVKDTVDFNNVENIVGNPSADTFVLNGGLDGLINGGAGLDTIIGSAQSNTFDVSSADSGTVSSASGTTAFANIENLTGGAAADTFLVNAGISGLIDGAAGFDTLVGAAGPNSFVVTSLDAGTVNTIDFVSIENLVGGNDNDTFLFNAPLSGNAIGDGGNDFFNVSPDILVSIDGGAGTDEVVINGPNSNDLGLANVENLAYVPEQVVYKVQGTVNSVVADLASDFSIGESFRLKYTFEPLAADTAPSADTGLYDAVVQAEVEVGSYSTSLSPTGLRRIVVYDNLNGIDRYRVDLSGVSGPSVAGLPLADQFPIFLLSDFTGAAFVDDALPVTGIDLGAFGQNDFLALKFERPDQTTAFVQASVDSFEVVPAFRDVPDSHWAATFVSIIAENGITAGCGLAKYCPDDEVTRAQMAVFLERGINGGNYVPPAASGNVFLDVGAGDFAANFIEQLSQDGITAGCGNNNFCPDDTVTRDQMAVFLLRAKYGSGYSPPAPTGVFGDVDLSFWAAAWIEQLAVEGITAGCGGGNYCPGAPVTRDQMAVFLVRTFEL